MDRVLWQQSELIDAFTVFAVNILLLPRRWSKKLGVTILGCPSTFFFIDLFKWPDSKKGGEGQYIETVRNRYKI